MSGQLERDQPHPPLIYNVSNRHISSVGENGLAWPTNLSHLKKKKFSTKKFLIFIWKIHFSPSKKKILVIPRNIFFACPKKKANFSNENNFLYLPEKIKEFLIVV